MCTTRSWYTLEHFSLFIDLLQEVRVVAVVAATVDPPHRMEELSLSSLMLCIRSVDAIVVAQTTFVFIKSNLYFVSLNTVGRQGGLPASCTRRSPRQGPRAFEEQHGHQHEQRGK